jgi:hypothetical protein
MSDTPDNVLPFKRPDQTVVNGSYVVPEDPRDIVSMAIDAELGFSSVVFLACPEDGLWEIQSPDALDQLAVHLIQLAVRMRGQGGPP